VQIADSDHQPLLVAIGEHESMAWLEIQDDLPQHEGWPPGLGPGAQTEDPTGQ